MLFISVSKIHFFCESQPIPCYYDCSLSCLSVCQRYIFFANHNKRLIGCSDSYVVYQCVKDTFFLRITTRNSDLRNCNLLFISVSKIHFFCESQPQLTSSEFAVRCLSVCQRYIFFANHNYKRFAGASVRVVYQCVKDTFFLRITTFKFESQPEYELFISVSKIHFFCESQHVAHL